MFREPNTYSRCMAFSDDTKKIYTDEFDRYLLAEPLFIYKSNETIFNDVIQKRVDSHKKHILLAKQVIPVYIK